MIKPRQHSSEANAGIELLSPGGGAELVTTQPATPEVGKFHGIRRRLTTKSTKPVLAGILAVAVLTAGGIVYATSISNAQTQYRLATVTNGTVTQSMTLSGSLAPISQAAVSFPTSGTVASVDVKEGQNVTAGEQLATFDTKSLRASITAAEESVADARLNLHQLKNGQTSTGGSSSGGASTRSVAVSTRASSQQPKPSNNGAPTSTNKLQEQITATQKAIDQALAVAKIDLASATTACASGAHDSAQSETAQPSAAPSSGTSTDCVSAQTEVMQDQSQISQLQQQQATQIEALNKATQSSAASPAPSGSSSTSTQSAKTATGEQLAAAQAQIDAAEAALAEAEQNLKAAIITAPISGKVLSVPFAEGDSATSTEAIQVSGSPQYQATVQVAVDKIGSIHIGQKATVVPSGSADPLDASVTSIAAAPTTSNSTVTYPVTLNIPGTHSELRSGSTATVEIITATVDNALSVPTSAVQSIGTFKIVNVLEDGTSTAKRVTGGAVGPTYTQIIDGLSEGEQIILANLDDPVPSSNNTFRIPTGGGFGGSGRGGGPLG